MLQPPLSLALRLVMKMNKQMFQRSANEYP